MDMGPKVGVCFRNPAKVEPYEAALRQAGLEPVRIEPDAGGALDGLDGLVLTGGTDVNPARYGQPCHEATGASDDARDELEAALLDRALERDVPVLAICRGLQLMNVVHGGTLIQHIGSETHAGLHLVRILPDTRLAAISGEGEREVNSRHHQAIDKVGDGLRVAACAADGVVEAIERPDKPFALAVQWHPEDRVAASEMDRKLFAAFADAVATFARSARSSPGAPSRP